MKKVLNVGGNSKDIAIAPQFRDWEHILLDIDPSVKPDVLCDARDMTTLPANEYDAVYCSHNLEHYYRHDVPKVLRGFLHVLKEDGVVNIRVPDIAKVASIMLERNADLDDILYQSPIGPISFADVLYGLGAKIEQSGQDFYAHKTGFTQRALEKIIHDCGFPYVYTACEDIALSVLAFKNQPTAEMKTLFDLP